VVVEGKDTKGDEHKVEMGRGPYILSGVARKQLVLFVPCIVTHMHHEDALYVRVCPVFEHVSCKFFLHLPTMNIQRWEKASCLLAGAPLVYLNDDTSTCTVLIQVLSFVRCQTLSRIGACQSARVVTLLAWRSACIWPTLSPLHIHMQQSCNETRHPSSCLLP
jgi:hypothetical protein